MGPDEGNTPRSAVGAGGPGGEAPRLDSGIAVGAREKPKNKSLTQRRPKRRYPPYVDACIHGKWAFRLWNRNDPGDPRTGEVSVQLCPYKCGSRRHEGPCRNRWNEILAERVRGALAKHDPRHVCYLVLTFKQSDPDARARTRYEAFDVLGRRWQSLKQYLTRHYGAIDFVAVAEVHRRGWPHLNVACVNADLADELRAGTASRRIGEHRPNAPYWFKRAAVRSGFGWVATAEVARNPNDVADYIAKLAGDVDSGLPGEIAKLTQAPEFAPPYFRSVRSSKGFLPPRPKDPDKTGVIAFATVRELTPKPLGPLPAMPYEPPASRPSALDEGTSLPWRGAVIDVRWTLPSPPKGKP